MQESNSLLFHADKAINGNWADRQAAMKELAKELGNLVEGPWQYDPDSKVWSDDKFHESIIEVIIDKPEYLAKLDPTSLDLIEYLKSAKSSVDAVLRLLEFIRAISKDNMIYSVNFPLIRRLIFLLNKIAATPESELAKSDIKRNINLIEYYRSRMAESRIRAVELGVEMGAHYYKIDKKMDEKKLQEVLDRAAEYIDSVEEFESLVKKNNEKDIIRRYVVALIAFQEKLKENKKIREMGFQELCKLMQAGETKAIELMVGENSPIPEFRILSLQSLISYFSIQPESLEQTLKYLVALQEHKPKDEHEFTNIMNYLAGIVALGHQGTSADFWGKCFFALTKICVEQKDLSRQQRSSLNLSQALESAFSLDDDSVLDAKMESLWRNKNRDFYTRIIDVLYITWRNWSDCDLLTGELERLVANCRVHQIPSGRVLMDIVSALIEHDVAKNAKAFLIHKMVFLIKSFSTISEQEFSDQNENNNRKAMEFFVEGEAPSIDKKLAKTVSVKEVLADLFRLSFLENETSKITEILEIALLNRAKVSRGDFLSLYFEQMKEKFSWPRYFILHTLMKRPEYEFHYDYDNQMSVLFDHFFRKSGNNYNKFDEMIAKYSEDDEWRCLSKVFQVQRFHYKVYKSNARDTNRRNFIEQLEKNLKELLNYPFCNEDENKFILDCLDYWIGEDDGSFYKAALLLGLINKFGKDETRIISYFWKIVEVLRLHSSNKRDDVDKVFIYLCKGNESLHRELINKIAQDESRFFKSNFDVKSRSYPHGLVYEIAFASYARGSEGNLRLLAEKGDALSNFLYGCYIKKMHAVNPEKYPIENASKNFDLAVGKNFPLAQFHHSLNNGIRSECEKSWNVPSENTLFQRVISFLTPKIVFGIPNLLDPFVRALIDEQKELQRENIEDNKDQVLLTLLRLIVSFKQETKEFTNQLQKIAYLIDQVLLVPSVVQAKDKEKEERKSPLVNLHVINTIKKPDEVTLNNQITLTYTGSL